MSSLPLSVRLRDATATMHRVAERSGIMRDLLAGRAEPAAYALLLRNLHPLYATLEDALDRHRASPQVAPLRIPELYRTAALAADLQALHGDNWAALPIAPATTDYCARLQELSCAQPAGLAAHAYVRYLGDLSGGQMLGGLVDGAYGRGDGTATAFYRFAEVGDIAAMKQRFRAALDALPLDAETADAVVAEAVAAFERHVALFEALAAPHTPAGS